MRYLFAKLKFSSAVHTQSPRHTNGSGGILCASKSDGRLTSWTLIVMLMWVFNSKGETIYHPLQALGHFLRIFSSFQWDEKAITVHGPADANGCFNM